MSAKGMHTFEGVEGVFGTLSISLEGCRLPLAEGNGVEGVAGLGGGRPRVAVFGVVGVCGGGPT